MSRITLALSRHLETTERGQARGNFRVAPGGSPEARLKPNDLTLVDTRRHPLSAIPQRADVEYRQ